MTTVNTVRPIAYLCAAAVLAAGSALLPGAGTASVPSSSGAAASATAAATTPAACGLPRESLRPTGPLPAPGAMPAGSTMARIAARGRLIVGVDQGKYLLGYRNPATDRIEGSDIDIVRRVATAVLGDPDKVQYVVLNIADRVGAIQRGQVDMVVNSFAVTCDRQRSIEFSSAYMAVSMRLLVPADSGVREIEDLAGKAVCTSVGSTTEVALHALPAALTLDVVTLPGIPDCMVQLQRGRVAAISSDDAILAGLAAQDPQTTVVGRSLLSSDYGIGMRPDAPDLVRFVNGVLEAARADGSLAASNQRWLAGALDPVPVVPAARYRD